MRSDLADLPPPDAILFDLDGTLIDTVETRIEAWLEALAEAGTPTTRDRLAPLIGLDGRRLAREIAALAGAPIDDDRAEAIDHRSGELYERRGERSRAVDEYAQFLHLWERCEPELEPLVRDARQRLARLAAEPQAGDTAAPAP